MVKRRARQRSLPPKEVQWRADRLKMVLTDNDGVLTDTGVYYSSAGEELKRYSVRDGMAVELLRNEGIETGIITAENSESLRRRAEKLGIRHVYLGIKDKRAHLEVLLGLTQFSIAELAYIGDDVNDLGILKAIGEHGLTAAPADAIPSVLSAVHYVASAPGGHGAFRDYADWILSHRRKRPGLSRS